MEDSKNTERKIPEMISAFAFESAMMHKDADNARLSNECERMHKLVRALVIAIIIIVLFLITTFVTTYTIRTRYWLNTFERFITAPVTEVQNAGVYSQTDQ